MRKLYIITVCLSVIQFISAQVEQLTPLKTNPQLYYSTRPSQSAKHLYKYLVDPGNIIVTTDTLTLPFVDDFSQNRLRSYKWVENHITDTFYNVIGGCLANEGITMVVNNFITDTAWFYNFNTLTRQVDSTPQPHILFNKFGTGGLDCFSAKPDTAYYWPTYFRFSFDTSGLVLDSVSAIDSAHLVTNTYATVVYFAQGEPGTLWFDNYAYVNNTYPINPPTIGVATLDGLNQFGLPYNNSSSTTYGQADYLTSKPIDLHTYTEADSLYLSFFFEAGGLGIVPHLADSLIVEFKDNFGQWNTMWADTGYSEPIYAPQTFQQILIAVLDTTSAVKLPHKFYHNAFQFRFRNMASLSGNTDHWHIDYVKFDKSRSYTDTAIQDIAFVYPFPSILKNYTEMPANLFRGASDLRDSVLLIVHNLAPNDTNPPATNFSTAAKELYPTQAIVATQTLATFNAAPTNYILVQPSGQYTIPDTLPVDSMVIFSKVSIAPNDNRPQNDTLYHTQNLNYVMAYDDGSAERAYGLTGLGLKKFAYEFDLAHPDTLAGFQIMFTQVNDNVSDLVFDFEGWDSLRLNDYTFLDTPVIQIDNKIPLYIDSVNGYATYVLDTPLIISGKFYFGWAQTDERSLQVGYDLNSTLGRQHMFIYTNAVWDSSAIEPEGSLMLRLILDSHYGGISSPAGFIDLTKGTDNPQVFPNPTSGGVNIRNTKVNTSYEVSVVDMVGQTVQHEVSVNDRFTISNLPNGMYLLTLRDIYSGKIFHSKIIKTSF